MPLENCASNPYTPGNINADAGSSSPPYYGSSGSFILIPSAANLLLSSAAPTVTIDRTAIEPPAANLALSTTAPTVERTTNHFISPEAAQLTFSSTAPELEMPWTLVNSWTHSGDVAQVDFTGLAGYTEVRVLIKDVTLSVSGQRSLRVSTDNGSTFLAAAGDYNNVAEDGQATTDTLSAFHLTSATAARSGEIIIRGFNLTANKTAHRVNRNTNTLVIIPTASALNAVRVLPSAGGNLTGGSIFVFAR